MPAFIKDPKKVPLPPKGALIFPGNEPSEYPTVDSALYDAYAWFRVQYGRKQKIHTDTTGHVTKIWSSAGPTQLIIIAVPRPKGTVK